MDLKKRAKKYLIISSIFAILFALVPIGMIIMMLFALMFGGAMGLPNMGSNLIFVVGALLMSLVSYIRMPVGWPIILGIVFVFSYRKGDYAWSKRVSKVNIVLSIVVLILVVLLFWTPICCGPMPLSDPRTEIGNALNATRSGGETTTRGFTMTKGDRIRSVDFENVGFEGASIVFYIDEDQGLPYDEGTGFFVSLNESDPDDAYSTLTYNGLTPRSAKARVMCLLTGTRLKNELENFEEISSEANEALCLADDSITPCCAVILRRAR